MLFINGASVDDFAIEGCPYAFQQYVLHTQLSLEDSTLNYARCTGHISVVLCDRGAMDGSAYMSPESFQQLLAKSNIDMVSARDTRYDAVFHLVTAADGAEDFYTLENNGARTETIDEAKAVDKRTQQAWIGHPRHFIIDNNNNKSFEQKLQELTNSIAVQCGLPSLKRHAFKYRLLEPPFIESLPNVQIFDVEKIILQTPHGVHAADQHTYDKEIKRFIRKRSQGRQCSYGLTAVRQLPSGAIVEQKQVISAKMYATLAATTADEKRSIIHQKRYCFLWEKQSFHIYQYLAPQEGIWLLFCQSAEGVKPVLPPFLKCSEEIAHDDDTLSAHNISLGNSHS